MSHVYKLHISLKGQEYLYYAVADDEVSAVLNTSRDVMVATGYLPVIRFGGREV